MKVREVSIQDYNKIKKLFKRNHLKMINLNKWKNLWNKNPILLNKKKWIKGWVLESNKNEVVGHIPEGQVRMKSLRTEFQLPGLPTGFEHPHVIDVHPGTEGPQHQSQRRGALALAFPGVDLECAVFDFRAFGDF